ncbi:hypothetical protein V6U81_04405 [Micromonospora sp. CPCC 205711]|uniref:hypothetical protein n=1 Tax=Micromonospora sp. CPCC 205547 TaxID=3122400 RepID=UPI002FF3B03B
MATLIFRFTQEDAERLGVAEVEYDPTRPRFVEVRELRKETGMNLVQFGDLCKDPSEQDYALGVVVWLALIRSGKRIPFEEFDIDVRGLVVDKAEVEDPNSLAPNGANAS